MFLKNINIFQCLLNFTKGNIEILNAYSVSRRILFEANIAKKNFSFIFLTFSVFSGDLILIFYTCLHCLDKQTCFAWSRFILGWVIEWVGYKIFIEKEISDENITIKNKSAKVYF